MFWVVWKKNELLYDFWHSEFLWWFWCWFMSSKWVCLNSLKSCFYYEALLRIVDTLTKVTMKSAHSKTRTLGPTCVFSLFDTTSQQRSSPLIKEHKSISLPATHTNILDLSLQSLLIQSLDTSHPLVPMENALPQLQTSRKSKRVIWALPGVGIHLRISRNKLGTRMEQPIERWLKCLAVDQ